MRHCAQPMRGSPWLASAGAARGVRHHGTPAPDRDAGGDRPLQGGQALPDEGPAGTGRNTTRATSRIGTASWYGADFQGLPTANGEVFDKEQITAAHPTLPLPSIVRVTNLENGRSIDVRVNDRGPFIGDRLIDLSQAAARKLGYENQGLAQVRVDFSRWRTTPRHAARRRPWRRRPAPLHRRSSQPSSCLRGAMVQVAALADPAHAPSPRGRGWRRCPARSGPAFVQIGAFGETDQVRAAMANVEDLGPLRVEPAFVGDRAVVRVRLGPVADPVAARRLLRGRWRSATRRVYGAGFGQGFGRRQLLSPGARRSCGVNDATSADGDSGR